MSITNLSTPLQVLHKLERERHRAYHHQNYVHKSDHLINFCLTALSLRDYMLHYLGIEGKDKETYHKEWKTVECLKVVFDIATTSKHFKMTNNTPITKTLEKSSSNVINVYKFDNGEIKTIEEDVPDCKITLEDGNEYRLFEFTQKVIDYWEKYLNDKGIEYVEQDSAVFFGSSKT